MHHTDGGTSRGRRPAATGRRRRCRTGLAVALTAVLAFAPPPAPAAGRAGSDAGAFLVAPARWSGREWGALAAGTAAVAGLGLLDEGCRTGVRDRRTPATRHGANLVRGGGDFLGWGGGLVAAAWLGGLATGNEGLEETGFEMAEAAVLSGAVVAGLKVAVGRSRPDRDEGAGTFHPFAGGLTGGRSSFPSQHATFAFAVASVAAERVEGLGWAAYPLAGLVALSRAHDDRHWLSDVAAGAAIGTVTGLWVAGRGGSGGAATLVPWLEGDAAGIAWAARF